MFSFSPYIEYWLRIQCSSCEKDNWICQTNSGNPDFEISYVIRCFKCKKLMFLGGEEDLIERYGSEYHAEERAIKGRKAPV